MFRTAFAMSAVVAMVAPAFSMEWMTDFDAAKAKAAAENKLVLVDFTGSDWCYYCKLLSEKVLTTPEFAAYIQDKFVPMEVDMPKGKPQAPELKQQNMKLSQQYRISGYPTVLVLSPQGDILGGFVGGANSLQQIQPALDAAWENRDRLATARAATGLDRAKAFAGIYASLSDDLKGQVDSYKQEILNNDPENVTGFRDVIAAEEEMKSISQELRAATDLASVVAVIDKKLPSVLPANKVQLMLIKSHFQTMSAETEADVIKAKQTALDAAALLPDAGESAKLRTVVEKEYADPAAVLRKAKNMRKRH